MLRQNGFDNEAYVQSQAAEIQKRVERFDKLYLEFGGKLFDDHHAARVLPGFDVNCKAKLLLKLKDQSEIIFCISAKAIEQNKTRSDVGVSYEMDVLRLVDSLRKWGLTVSAILITQYERQPLADVFQKKMTLRGERVYIHTLTKGYPSDVNMIVSQEGYGANPFIETSKPIVVVTAPGPGNGKLATCLSQMYHEHLHGQKTGYAKFETFPVWDLPLRHPVNIAYEAAAADLKDVNMIDPYHLSAYGKTAVNYNRDIEIFPVLRAILKRVVGNDIYESPTDMGVNMIGSCIIDQEIVGEAARQEIIRRWFNARCAHIQGKGEESDVKRIEFLMSSLDLKPQDRRVVDPANDKARSANCSAVALELPDGAIITGKSSPLMNDTASVVLNAIKHIAGIADNISLISRTVLEPIISLKKNMLGSRYPVLKLEEILQALSICVATNPTAELALRHLPALRDCEAHCSDIITQDDAATFIKLGIRFTCEPQFPTTDLYFH